MEKYPNKNAQENSDVVKSTRYKMCRGHRRQNIYIQGPTNEDNINCL